MRVDMLTLLKIKICFLPPDLYGITVSLPSDSLGESSPDPNQAVNLILRFLRPLDGLRSHIPFLIEGYPDRNITLHILHTSHSPLTGSPRKELRLSRRRMPETSPLFSMP